MPGIKITVVKKMVNQELADEYMPGMGVCPLFDEGQEFVMRSVFANPDNGPENFCGWAWNDIYKKALLISAGGGPFDRMIVCCTDGIRPVVFKVERTGD